MLTPQLGSSASDESSIEEALRNIAARLRQELAQPSDESLIRVAAAHNELRQLPAGTPSVSRAECLIEIAQFFYLSGQTTLGFDPATRAIEAARAVSDYRVPERVNDFAAPGGVNLVCG
jgi:hypothetical protein